MSNEEKYKVLYYSVGFTKDSSIISDVNSFFDESFVEYLINKEEWNLVQLLTGLKAIDFSKIVLSDPISNRDKKLLLYLLNKMVNIDSIISRFSEKQYDEFCKYLKELYELKIISIKEVLFTNDLKLISSFDLTIDNVNILEKCLYNDKINNNVKQQVLSIEGNKKMFIESFNVWNFYNLVDKLKLDKTFKEERVSKLIECLNNSNLNVEDFREIVCELICQDSYYNFMINLEMIYNYCASEKDIPNELGTGANYLMLVKDLLNEEDISKIDINFFIDKYMIIGDIYSKSIDLIKANFNNKLNNRLKDKDIYFVHTIHTFDFEKSSNIKEVYNKNLSHPSKRASFSLLNNEKTGIYINVERAIVFGYNKTPNNNLLCASLSDARTAQSRIWTRGNYLSIDDYLKKTSSGHNELVYGDIDCVIEPDYLLSFHEKATELEQRISNEFNIPIKYLKYNDLRDNISNSDKEYKFDYKSINYITNNLNTSKTL